MKVDIPLDIRDRESLEPHEIIALNFIRNPAPYLYRKHHFWGMRSHIFQILDPRDVKNETDGIDVNGLTVYPAAKPLKMLRLFRRKFNALREALEEIQSVRAIEKYLGPDHFARSSEFLVDYRIGRRHDPMLCGLQEYIEGERLDLWHPINSSYLLTLPAQLSIGGEPVTTDAKNRFLQAVRQNTAGFIDNVKKMITQAGRVPDLAGTGNLILTAGGNIKLVDINNVSPVTFQSKVEIDDKGYPACDMSIKALSMLETKLLERTIDPSEAIYRVYLDPHRKKAVRARLDEFHNRNRSSPP